MTDEMPVSKTAQEIIAKLHPAIKEEWRVKLLAVEAESLAWHTRGMAQAVREYGVDDEGPE